MQEIKKILRAVFEKNHDQLTDPHRQPVKPAEAQLTLRTNYYCSDSMGPAPTGVAGPITNEITYQSDIK